MKKKLYPISGSREQAKRLLNNSVGKDRVQIDNISIAL